MSILIRDLVLGGGVVSDCKCSSVRQDFDR